MSCIILKRLLLILGCKYMADGTTVSNSITLDTIDGPIRLLAKMEESAGLVDPITQWIGLRDPGRENEFFFSLALDSLLFSLERERVAGVEREGFTHPPSSWTREIFQAQFPTEVEQKIAISKVPYRLFSFKIILDEEGNLVPVIIDLQDPANKILLINYFQTHTVIPREVLSNLICLSYTDSILMGKKPEDSIFFCDLYLNRPEAIGTHNLGIHTDRGELPSSLKAHDFQAFHGAENLWAVSLLYLHEDPDLFLRGTTVLRGDILDPTGDTIHLEPLTLRVKHRMKICFRDDILIHCSPLSEVTLPFSLLPQATYIMRPFEKEYNGTVARPDIVVPIRPTPFAQHLQATEEGRAVLARTENTTRRSFIRNHLCSAPKFTYVEVERLDMFFKRWGGMTFGETVHVKTSEEFTAALRQDGPLGRYTFGGKKTKTKIQRKRKTLKGGGEKQIALVCNKCDFFDLSKQETKLKIILG